MNTLEVRNLGVGYGGVLAVYDLSIDVAEGELVALLGPNGAGKTTSLMAIAGFLKPDAGTVNIAGELVTGVGSHRLARRGVGYVPDDRALIPSLTVQENFDLVRSPTMDPFELFPELQPMAKRNAGVLSGGEQQMVALARVLVSRPRLLLIDELSLGLAPLVVTRLLEALRSAVDELGTSVLLVEQHVDQALRFADRACVMVRGRIRLEESTAVLREDRQLIEASYLGGHDGITADGAPASVA